MGTPQIIWIVVAALGCYLSLDKPTMATPMGIVIFSALFENFLLYWGGFYDTISHPQVTWVVAYTFLATLQTMSAGKPTTALPQIVIPIQAGMLAILYWGGFFS